MKYLKLFEQYDDPFGEETPPLPHYKEKTFFRIAKNIRRKDGVLHIIEYLGEYHASKEDIIVYKDFEYPFNPYEWNMDISAEPDDIIFIFDEYNIYPGETISQDIFVPKNWKPYTYKNLPDEIKNRLI